MKTRSEHRGARFMSGVPYAELSASEQDHVRRCVERFKANDLGELTDRHNALVEQVPELEKKLEESIDEIFQIKACARFRKTEQATKGANQ